MRTKFAYILLLSLFFFANSGIAQEFQFQLFFEDANGNKDTLIIAYDPNGNRDIVQEEYGEENIAHIPFDTIFDVRITNYLEYQVAGTDLFHTKKKTVLFNCVDHPIWSHPHPYVNIDIQARHWPVTVTWDSSLFSQQCVEGSVFTPWYPRDWWDTGGYFSDFYRILLANNNTITFSANYPENYNDPLEWPPMYYIEDVNNLPISTFWMAFGAESLLSLSTSFLNNPNDIQVYPNPTRDLLNFSFGDSNLSIEKISVYDMNGNQFLVSCTNNVCDLSLLPNGIYILLITDDRQLTSQFKIVLKK